MIENPPFEPDAAAALAGGEQGDGAGSAQLVGQAPGAGLVDPLRGAGVVQDEDAFGVALAGTAHLDQPHTAFAQQGQDEPITVGEGVFPFVAGDGVYDDQVGQVGFQTVRNGIGQVHQQDRC